MRKTAILPTVFFIFSALVMLGAAGAAQPPRYEEVVELFTLESRDDPMKHPSDVAVAADGTVYVLDGVNNRVLLFSPEGRLLSSFGRGGGDPGEFNFPLGLCLDGRGRVYVADSGNHRVQVFTAGGEYLYHIDMDGEMPADPTDTAVDDRRGLLYIVDNDNHRLLTYDLRKGAFIAELGEMGMLKEGLRWPFSVAVDSEGYVFIVDVINTRVRVVTPDGRFANNIGRWGVDRGQFFRPKGVAVDSGDRVYVTDSYLGVIQVFDRSGGLLAVLGDESGKVRRFVTPVRIAIDESDRIYVVEMFAGRVRVFGRK
ncbi:MAG TPA: 6-bladed beta-propeller [Deltaproteobacteria bacterium]|nr:6-bladed beta-propeller [Deltaproteobacteria bacterium]